MVDESALKKLKIRDLEPSLLEQLESLGFLSKQILDPERTLYAVYKELEKQKEQGKYDEHVLQEAVDAICAQGELLARRSIVVRHKEAGRAFPKGVNLMRPENSSTVQTKIVSQIPLIKRESVAHLLQGNEDFQVEVKKLDKGRIDETKKEYDIIVLTCADARCDATLFRDFTNQRILFLQVAGNVYDPKDTKSRSKLEAALDLLKPNGTVIVMGHEKCGAVDAHAHKEHYSGKISRHIDMLVNCVDRHSSNRTHDDYQANAANQAKRLLDNRRVITKKVTVIPCIFDFTKGEDMALRFLGEGKEPNIITDLRHSGISRRAYAREHGYDLSAQYAHAIMVSDPTNLGQFTNPHVLYNARLNEVFAVSALNGELSSDAIASIEYALLKVNGVKDAPHIAITHTDVAEAKKLKDQLLKESDIIREKTRNGELISLMHYDKETHGVKAA